MTHAKLAEDLGITRSSIFVMENGRILELDEREARVTGKVASEQILVDGLGVGDVGNIVLRDQAAGAGRV